MGDTVCWRAGRLPCSHYTGKADMAVGQPAYIFDEVPHSSGTTKPPVLVVAGGQITAQGRHSILAEPPHSPPCKSPTRQGFQRRPQRAGPVLDPRPIVAFAPVSPEEKRFSLGAPPSGKSWGALMDKGESSMGRPGKSGVAKAELVNRRKSFPSVAMGVKGKSAAARVSVKPATFSQTRFDRSKTIKRSLRVTGLPTVGGTPSTNKETEQIVCPVCHLWMVGGCLEHSLRLQPDSEAVKGTPEYSKNSCPAGVSVSPSKIKHAGLGAWADVVIEPGTTFGPYTGDIVNSKEAADRSGYSWEINHKGKRYFVDGVDESKGNWMRFVNHASATQDKNMEAIQLKGQIYYVVIRQIRIGEELFVDYGQNYEKTIPKAPEASATKKVTLRQEESGPTPMLRSSQFNCQCKESFTTADYLATHQKRKHKSKKHRCHLCEFSTDYKRNLVVHKKAVHEKSMQNKHRCPLCPYSSYKNGHLVRHMRTHSKERPYQCSYCEQRFTETGSRKTHERTVHQKQQPYMCTTCGKTFGQKMQLVVHNLTVHEERKPYKCSICNKRFGRNYNLTVHMRVHTGEKPYQCTVCQKRFTHNSHCRRHEREVHWKETLV